MLQNSILDFFASHPYLEQGITPHMFDMEKDSEGALRRLRLDIVDMAEHSSHVAAAFSCVEILAALYFGVLRVSPDDAGADDRDRFILSKGHGCMALYAVLARRGFLPLSALETYAHDHSTLAEHPLAGKVPGIEFAAGSLGHGLAVAAGMAKALSLQGNGARVFVLLGDGECDEGTVWEAAAFAATQGLGNLTAIVDANGMQACGRCSEVSQNVSLTDAWAAFGWQVEEVDGHNVGALREVLDRKAAQATPRVVIAHTKKGKGIPYMEDNLEYHYRPLRGEEREKARRSLSDA